MKQQVAKIFMNGRSQALRLPLDFRFDCQEVFVCKDKFTGHIIVSKKPGNWQDFFSLCAQSSVPDNFMKNRENDREEEKDLFAV